MHIYPLKEGFRIDPDSSTVERSSGVYEGSSSNLLLDVSFYFLGFFGSVKTHLERDSI